MRNVKSALGMTREGLSPAVNSTQTVSHVKRSRRARDWTTVTTDGNKNKARAIPSENWTLTADPDRSLQAFKHMCDRRLLRISYTEHRTKEFFRQITCYAGRQEPFLATVKRRELVH